MTAAASEAAPGARPDARRAAARFLVAGGLNTAFTYLLMWALLQALAGVPYAVALANGGAYLVGIAVSFVANRRWTFRSGGDARGQLPRFVAAHLGSLALSSALMEAGVSRAGLPVFACFCLVVPLITALNFTLQRRWVFAAPAAR